ncbi:hypothetical protein QUB80_15580 [Chlorogloeopsis sp. ULAP01]|uniref:hypothetical protein n=1 Tax=Chlorogloeopsis sp. ULAP01 TaxID=3056483 RepID=UPI0025AA3A9E|nr:hypothetical protein [Chlorogloeopsis sp. ULAP01]MDM9382123.1 hypothetical protein [Chlorogloeopsis sp. ULAP01]
MLRQSSLQNTSRRCHVTAKYILLLVLFVDFLSHTSAAFAHQVKTTGDVGAILHIEPNDNPRAGERTKAWFALTRKGGRVIRLAECNCQLKVYAEPHASGEPPLLEPALQALTAERYQGVPGTELTFPRQGTYQLQLRGKPKTGASFKPFELKFNVTVAAGNEVSENSRGTQDGNQNFTQARTSGLPLWAIASFGLIVVGVFLAVVQQLNRE